MSRLLVETIFHSHAVRRLYKPDRLAYEAHLVRLDPATRYDRFGHQVSDDFLRDYAGLCFKSGAVVYGYFEDHVIRGAAELRLFPQAARPLERDGEAAFSVETPWRRRGIGTELMSHVVLAARNRRVGELTIFCLRHNQAMLALARKFETDLAFERNEITGHLVARPPSPLSFLREMVDNAVDLGSAALDFQTKAFRAAATR